MAVVKVSEEAARATGVDVAAINGPDSVVLSGTDEAALRRQIEALATALDRMATGVNDGEPALSDLAYTLAVRRTPLPRRVAFVVRDLIDLQAQLRHWPVETSASHPPGAAPMDAPELHDVAKVFETGGTVDRAAL